MYNWWHYHLSLKKEESWYGIIQYKAAAGERIVPTLFLILPAPSPHGPFWGRGWDLEASLQPGGGVWGCLGSKIWWGGTGI